MDPGLGEELNCQRSTGEMGDPDDVRTRGRFVSRDAQLRGRARQRERGTSLGGHAWRSQGA